MTRPPLVVYSHLRWDSVFQRPHQVLSRLASTRRVFFVEEPVHEPDAEPSWEIREAMPDLLVCRPHTPVEAAGFDDAQLDALLPLARSLLRGAGTRQHVAWLYTPMALPLAKALEPELLVYDCMDELSAFLGAPAAMRRREAELLDEADVVFTGGPSLYRSKRELHANVHCVPSSVDAAHFRPARDRLPEPRDVAPIPRPRLGFFGVIDERLDADLVRATAEARPDWQVVLVGPVVKIDPATLPRLPNVHYLGQRAYDELPRHLASWDVCLLPFARNDATRMISPTKTLEYLAAEKPVVATPIRDVADLYDDVVLLADDADAFVAACERALLAAASPCALRAERIAEILRRTSWDATAERMSRELDRALLRRHIARRRPLAIAARRTTALARP